MVDVGRPPKSVRVVIVRSESLAQLTARVLDRCREQQRPAVSARGATRRSGEKCEWNRAEGRRRPTERAQADTEGGPAPRPGE